MSSKRLDADLAQCEVCGRRLSEQSLGITSDGCIFCDGDDE